MENEINIEELIYTGIGSRDTPEIVTRVEVRLGEILARLGIKLRSGHADGSDKNFEIGCVKANGKKEIYLPWKGFNNSNSEYCIVTREAIEMAKEFHPAWDRLSRGAKLLMGRNSQQIFGYEMNKLTNGIICYTEGGKFKGGTAQALRIANHYNVPIFNLGTYSEECSGIMINHLCVFLKAYFKITDEQFKEIYKELKEVIK